ncbi:hypothetical protein AAVH_00911 [Aphelenchoides avenae]|nr:hypothetical protein AAVH_00911 [Aphelenchus avenae]
MALIYSSAVNKRIMHGPPRNKRSVGDTPHNNSDISHCRQRSNEESRSVAAEHGSGGARKRSTSSGTNSSCTCTPSQSAGGTPAPPADVSDRGGNAGSSTKPRKFHKPIQRSRTSCSDLKKRMLTNGGDVIEERPTRKISTPVMAQSMMVQSMTTEFPIGHDMHAGTSKHSSKSHMRKIMAKKRAQEYSLDDPDEYPRMMSNSLHAGLLNHSNLDRRRSISLDAEDWIRRVEMSPEPGMDRKKSGEGGAFQKMRNKFNKWKLSMTSADGR